MNFGHFKEICPFIRCYWCRKIGYTKDKCFFQDFYGALQNTRSKREQIVIHEENKKKERKKARREYPNLQAETTNFKFCYAEWEMETPVKKENYRRLIRHKCTSKLGISIKHNHKLGICL